MKITSKVLSILPYVSTIWKNVSSLHVREEKGSFHLTVFLNDGSKAEVPGLDQAAVTAIFDAHARSAETESAALGVDAKNPALISPYSFSLPLKSDGATIDSFPSPTQHNPEQANLPPLPPSVLKKITAVAKAFGVEDSSSLPNGEPGCNCLYCQVMNAMHGEESTEEVEVSEEDLKFRNWDILQTADKIYIVTNPLDANEHYSVFLGNPLGCTCGHKNCEHIRAVLNT